MYIVFLFGSKGGITGRIYGSPNFNDGDRIETSPIVSGPVDNGIVVRTGSGSRYFLSADTSIKSANIQAAMQMLSQAKPGATIMLTKELKQRDAKAALEAIEKAQPRATFSLFGLGSRVADDDTTTVVAPAQAQVKKPAPAPPANPTSGVPKIVRWKKNGDGSVTGFISGSSKFKEGEKVTTSPITKGPISPGQVVTTGSGSKYFLV